MLRNCAGPGLIQELEDEQAFGEALFEGGEAFGGGWAGTGWICGGRARR